MNDPEKSNLPIPQSRSTDGLGGMTPLAWELLVRDQRTDWRRYSIYETEKAAINTMERAKGEPLQLKVRPLYALEGISVRDRPDCKTCANRGRIDGLSQESHCDHCQWQENWRTDHYAPNAKVSGAGTASAGLTG